MKNFSIFLLVCLASCALPERSISSYRNKKIDINFSPRVSAIAVERAKLTVDTMLSHSPWIKTAMIDRSFTVEVIARDQLMTDIERYRYLKNERSFDGRDWSSMRGVGSSDSCSVGEENLLCDQNQKYESEDIFVHEFAHSILFNLDDKTKNEVERAYQNARANQIYPLNQYVMATVDEYWAEGAQAWFNASVRADVNGGINTREKMREADPELAGILQKIYGDVEIPKRDGCSY